MNVRLEKIVTALVAVRKARGLSQAEVARLIDRKQSSVSSFENGREGVQLATLLRYAEAVGCEIRVDLRAVTVSKRVNGDAVDPKDETLDVWAREDVADVADDDVELREKFEMTAPRPVSPDRHRVKSIVSESVLRKIEERSKAS